jgi:hypothetical protein
LNGTGAGKKNTAALKEQAVPRAELGKIAETMISNQGESCD